MFARNMQALRERLSQQGIDVAIITDEDSVYYFCGYYDYLHMEFGRPTLLIIPRDGDSLLITPAIDLRLAEAHARVDRIMAWNDGRGDEWREHLPRLLQGAGRVGVESGQMPMRVREYVESLVGRTALMGLGDIIADMRMIKSEPEIKMARHAGEVANEMMVAGRSAIADGVREYEVALATSAAGTRKAAELLGRHYDDTAMSPSMHFLQIMASGSEIVKTHHRASRRVMRHGEPVFLCFCGMANFHRFKLGFDRTFWIGEIVEPAQEQVYRVAVESQAAALKVLRPGVTAEAVHAEYAEVIQGAGYEYPFRCGRGTGFSYLERPQLVYGDDTVLQPGMVLAVDGSVSTDTFRAQVGDSFILNDDGYEMITDHPKAAGDVVIT